MPGRIQTNCLLIVDDIGLHFSQKDFCVTTENHKCIITETVTVKVEQSQETKESTERPAIVPVLVVEKAST